MPRPDHIDEALWTEVISALGHDPYERRIIEAESSVFSPYGSESWTIPELQDLLNKAIAEVKANHGFDAKVEFNIEHDYDSTYCSLGIKYRRWETEQEAGARGREEFRKKMHSIQKTKERDLAELERLQQKYGANPMGVSS